MTTMYDLVLMLCDIADMQAQLEKGYSESSIDGIEKVYNEYLQAMDEFDEAAKQEIIQSRSSNTHASAHASNPWANN